MRLRVQIILNILALFLVFLLSGFVSPLSIFLGGSIVSIAVLIIISIFALIFLHLKKKGTSNNPQRITRLLFLFFYAFFYAAPYVPIDLYYRNAGVACELGCGLGKLTLVLISIPAVFVINFLLTRFLIRKYSYIGE